MEIMLRWFLFQNICAVRFLLTLIKNKQVFTILASISLQGIRLAKPTLGEYFVVYGLGIIGLITVQLLRANGCKVLEIDFDKQKN